MKKIFYPFAFALTAFLFVYSCSTDQDDTPPSAPTSIVKYTVTLTAGEGGSVSTSGGQYQSGQTLSVTAIPQAEYVFKNWSDGNTDATRTIMVSSNTNLTATFEKKKYSLTINIQGKGTVTEEIVSTGKSTEYYSGNTLKLIATPAEGWEFEGWTGAIETNESEIELLMDEAKLVNAVFVIKYFELTIEKEEDYFSVEIISGEKHPDKKNHYSFGTILEISFEDLNGLIFKDVSGDIETSKRSFRLVLNKDFNISPNYLKGTWINFNINVQIKDKDVTLSGKDFPLQEYQNKLIIEIYPIEIINLENEEIVWKEDGSLLFSLPYEGYAYFENKPSIILPPGNYRIKTKNDPNANPELFQQIGYGVNYFRYGRALPSYINQEFSIVDGEEDITLNLTAYIPNFALFTFEENDPKIATDYHISIEIYNENGSYTWGYGTQQHRYMSNNGDSYRHIYFSLENAFKDNFGVRISFRNRKNNTSIKYPMENSLVSGSHIHYQIYLDEYGYPFIKEELQPVLKLKEVTNNIEKFETGFLKIKEFNLIDSNKFFASDIIGDSLPKWNYSDLISEKGSFSFNNIKNYNFSTEILTRENQKEININFIPLNNVGVSYFNGYLSITYDDSNGFQFFKQIGFYIDGRYKELDFNNLIQEVDLSLLSLPKENYDEIRIYGIYNDYNLTELPPGIDQQFFFRTSDGFIAAHIAKMKLYQDYYYYFISNKPRAIFSSSSMLFQGVLLRGFKDGILVKEKTFKIPEYKFEANKHYNFKL